MTIALTLYAAGVAVGLFRTDASTPGRFGLALLWPLGPLAFAATVSLLLLTSLVAFPIFGGIVVTAAAVAAYLVS